MYNKSEQIGKMRERVTIQTASEAANAYGERIETWSTLATVWAQVEYRLAVGDEDLRADRMTALRTVHFTIRSRTDFTEKARIGYRDKTYNITSIAESPDRAFQTLETEMRE